MPITKKTFAKIIELKNCQVLVTKDFEHAEEDDGDDTYKLVQTTDLPGLRLSMDVGFTSEIDRDELFKAYSEKDALKFVKAVQALLNEPKKSTKKKPKKK